MESQCDGDYVANMGWSGDHQEKKLTGLELYYAAKEAYYNGTPIMEDFEFDELEKKLGLENKSYIGAKHNPSYTIQHPFIMGSLSKVQIKRADDGSVDWPSYYAEVLTYLHRYQERMTVIVTPKFDGCSFETVVKNQNITSIATRGDGEWGKDIKQHLLRKFDETHTSLDSNYYTLRGEVLIDKSVFAQKYSDFVNPRSFVSGLLNREYDENDTEMQAMLDDLSIVIYDTRFYEYGTWRDYDWTDFIGKMHNLPEFYQEYPLLNEATFERIYNDFAKYRETCPFALDGIVMKPTAGNRISDLGEARPKDCVAVKFIPMLEETEIVDIEWNTGKTNELHPVIIVKPVIMDGKQITRASAHNYGYMIENRISIGTKVVLSLAGDIIPFIYKITNTDAFDRVKMNIPEGIDSYVDGVHLYKNLTLEEYKQMKFVQSAESLGIPNIGPAAARVIYDYLVIQSAPDDFLGIEGKEVPFNILCCTGSDINNALGGKTGAAAMKSFDEFKKKLSLTDIIVSCTFDACGRKVAEAIQNYLLLGEENFEHLAEKAWSWCKNPNSDQMTDLYNVLEHCGKTLDIFKQELQYVNETKRDQIPVILTGEPNNYATKDAFLREHPEYRMTGSWKEVKIVFTNSLDSNTGKMKKAREKGIEIRLY